MFSSEETAQKRKSDKAAEKQRIADATANRGDPGDERIPRVKGLIELLNQYLCRNRKEEL